MISNLRFWPRWYKFVVMVINPTTLAKTILNAYFVWKSNMESNAQILISNITTLAPHCNSPSATPTSIPRLQFLGRHSLAAPSRPQEKGLAVQKLQPVAATLTSTPRPLFPGPDLQSRAATPRLPLPSHYSQATTPRPLKKALLLKNPSIGDLQKQKEYSIDD